MTTYTYHDDMPEAMRDDLITSLRRAGYQASRETDTLRTDATLTAVALVCGSTAAIAIDQATYPMTNYIGSHNYGT